MQISTTSNLNRLYHYLRFLNSHSAFLKLASVQVVFNHVLTDYGNSWATILAQLANNIHTPQIWKRNLVSTIFLAKEEILNIGHQIIYME